MENARFVRRTLGAEPQPMDKAQLQQLVELVQGQKALEGMGVPPAAPVRTAEAPPAVSYLSRLLAMFQRQAPHDVNSSGGIRG
jgi:hypothetical protein